MQNTGTVYAQGNTAITTRGDINNSGANAVISVPIQINRRASRKVVKLPNGDVAVPRPWDTSATPLQMALVRGYRWLAMLESGEVRNLSEIGAREKIDNSYVSRMVNLTSLAPDIVEAILDDSLPNHVTLFDLAVDPPLLWNEQRSRLSI
ncbi:MAG: LacI family transcriptional regulator [Brachymonas sp.]